LGASIVYRCWGSLGLKELLSCYLCFIDVLEQETWFYFMFHAFKSKRWHEITRRHILVPLKREETRKIKWNLSVFVPNSPWVYIPDILMLCCVQMDILSDFSFFCDNNTTIYYWSKIFNRIDVLFLVFSFYFLVCWFCIYIDREKIK